jgi:crotonobetainyl-CoA:carnitine CoA-transferase CaiB-like acyl-CoA transferase
VTVEKAGALQGLRVLDLTLMLAGPFASMLLADQGADVIKVEPKEGDFTRVLGPYHKDDSQRAFGGYFQSINRNKRSITIDLKSTDGREVFLKLVRTSDVLVENFRAGVLDRLGLSYETLRKENPKLVYAAIRGFGDPRMSASPYADWPAYDVVAQAMGGVMGITGPDANSPTKVGPGVGDVLPAVFCAYGVMAAVFRAQRTGQGQFVDVSMLDCILALCERSLYQYTYENRTPGPEGNRHPFIAPFGMIPCRDGYVTIACPADNFWFELCRLMKRPDLASDPRFASIPDRAKNADALYHEVGAYAAQYTKRELLAKFGGRIPFGPVYTMPEIASDPHFVARDMIVPLDHPGCPHPIGVAGIPIKMSETPGALRRRAPLLSEHAVEVLSDIGMSASEIEDLKSRRIVGVGQ